MGNHTSHSARRHETSKFANEQRRPIPTSEAQTISVHSDSDSVPIKAVGVGRNAKTIAAKEIDLDDFRSPGIKRTPLLERRNMNSRAPSLTVAVPTKPKQLFADPRSPTVPRSPVS